MAGINRTIGLFNRRLKHGMGITETDSSGGIVMRTAYRLIFVASALSLSACEASHITAAKSVCACFDVANYKIGKGHNEAGQTYERCRKELNGYIKRYEADTESRTGFFNALKKCPNATIVAPSTP